MQKEFVNIHLTAFILARSLVKQQLCDKILITQKLSLGL